MKILIVHPQMAIYGGAEVVIVKLAKWLMRHNHEVSIATLTTDDHADYKGLDIIVPENEKERIQYHLRNGSLSTLNEIAHIYFNLRNLVMKLSDKYDVINAHNFPTIWTCPKNKPIVWMCNEIPDLWHNQQVNKYINPFLNVGRFGDRVITDSKHAIAVVADDGMAKLFKHRYGYQPEIVTYGVDGEFYYNNRDDKYLLKIMEKYGINKSKSFVIIQPSMISPSKQQLEILKAITMIGVANIKMLFTGYRERTNPYTIKVKEYIAEHEIDAVFTDMCVGSKTEMPYLYKLAHVSVLMGKGQGSWLSPLESIVSGCPTIVSPNLTVSSVIREHELGLVTTDTAWGIKQVYRDYQRFQLHNIKAQNYVLNNFTWDRYCQSLNDLMVRCCR